MWQDLEYSCMYKVAQTAALYVEHVFCFFQQSVLVYTLTLQQSTFVKKNLMEIDYNEIFCLI